MLSIPVGLENEQLCSGAAAAAHESEGQGGGQQGRGSLNGAGEQHHVSVDTPTYMSHLQKREDCPRPAGFTLGGLFRRPRAAGSPRRGPGAGMM